MERKKLNKTLSGILATGFLGLAGLSATGGVSSVNEAFGENSSNSLLQASTYLEGEEVTSSEDTSTEDASTEDTSTEDASTEDTSTEDANTEDTSTEDTSTEDTSTEDTSTEDASTEDASTEDANTEDASAEDANTEDASTEDANTEDASTEDASTEDVATDVSFVTYGLRPFYRVGEPLDLTNGKFVKELEDGTVEITALDESMLQEVPTFTELGDLVLTFHFDGYDYDFTITVLGQLDETDDSTLDAEYLAWLEYRDALGMDISFDSVQVITNTAGQKVEIKLN